LPIKQRTVNYDAKALILDKKLRENTDICNAVFSCKSKKILESEHVTNDTVVESFSLHLSNK